VEFYGIVSNGGFDVIIGNPPYVEYAAVLKDYTIDNAELRKPGNLHGMVTLRSLSLLSKEGSRASGRHSRIMASSERGTG